MCCCLQSRPDGRPGGRGAAEGPVRSGRRRVRPRPKRSMILLHPGRLQRVRSPCRMRPQSAASVASVTVQERLNQLVGLFKGRTERHKDRLADPDESEEESPTACGSPRSRSPHPGNLDPLSLPLDPIGLPKENRIQLVSWILWDPSGISVGSPSDSGPDP